MNGKTRAAEAVHRALCYALKMAPTGRPDSVKDPRGSAGRVGRVARDFVSLVPGGARRRRAGMDISASRSGSPASRSGSRKTVIPREQ